MTPEVEARFLRIETGLEIIKDRIDRMSVEAELSRHDFDLRTKKLTEFQAVLMESQNDAWQSIQRLSDKIDRLIDGRGPNGIH